MSPREKAFTETLRNVLPLLAPHHPYGNTRGDEENSPRTLSDLQSTVEPVCLLCSQYRFAYIHGITSELCLI